MLLQTTGSVATSPILLTAPAEAFSAGTACASLTHWTGAFAQQSMASRFTVLARYMGELWLCSALSFHRPSSTLSQHLRFLRTMESAALRRLQAALVSDATWQRAPTDRPQATAYWQGARGFGRFWGRGDAGDRRPSCRQCACTSPCLTARVQTCVCVCVCPPQSG